MTLQDRAAKTRWGLDDALSEWLEAARVGGLPAPTRDDRWQPLRAGVAGLWEFDVTEYWYARGWVQLTGRNETGKSSLMALTTLIPWLADTSSNNIDTLGRSGKRFRYYVEPTGNDGDRRPSDSSTNRGWLWVEYGRLVGGEPRFFTTMLFAETRSASSNVNLTWCTAEGLRVRESVDLAPGRVVAHPKDLATPGFLAHPSAASYKEHVARHLLGTTVDRLEAAGKMLRVTRTPKLGAELKVAFVSEHLRTALPELDRTEVDALAAGWDQLDQLRADLDATRQAVETVERFRKSSWLPWVRAELRRRADAAARARTDFDRVTREERQALESVESLTGDQTRLEGEVRQATQDADSAGAAREALQDSDRYRDAQARIDDLERRRGEASGLSAELDRRVSEVDRASTREAAGEEDVARHESDATRASRAAESAHDRLAEAAALAGVPLAGVEVDLPLLEQRLRERRGGIDRARRLLSEATRADREAGVAEEAALTAQDRARDDEAAAEAALGDAHEVRDALVKAIALWASHADPAPAAGDVDRWIDGLPADYVEGRAPGILLREQVREDWFHPHETALTHRRHDAERRRAEAEASVVDLTRSIDELASASVPVFAPPDAWARRARPDPSPSGAPLWLLVDPRPGLSPDRLAHLEAALAAQGLLDTWVTPDGVYHPDEEGADTVLSLADSAHHQGGVHHQGDGPTLADVLVAAEPASPLGRVVDSALAGVRLLQDEEPIPASGLAVGLDGRWRGGVLTGTAAPRHGTAEWLGESARAAQRRRLIQELELERSQAAERMRAAESERDDAAAAIAALDAHLGRCPSDAELGASLTRVDERARVAERSAEEARAKRRVADDSRTSADRAVSALHEFCSDASLPNDSEGLNAAVDLVSSAERRSGHLRSALAASRTAEHALEAALERLEAHRDDRVRAERLRDEASRLLAEAYAVVEALEATMGADDQAVVAELQALREREADAKTRRNRLEETLRDTVRMLGEARAKLEGVQLRREQATQARDAAFVQFRVAINRGLADEASLELPEAHASTIDRVREQVTATRREVQVSGWPADDRDGQESLVRRLYGRLIEGVHELRASLETRGRSARMATDEMGIPVIEVVVDASGKVYSPREASARLAQIHQDLSETYTVRVRETLDELLGSTFLEHLRGRVGATDALVEGINRVLAQHPVVTTKTSLRIRLEPASESDGRMLAALRGPSLVNPEAAAHVREYLRLRVEAAKREAASHGEADWRERLVEALDYRRWFEVHLQRKIGQSGTWRPLTTQSFAEMSGGARAVVLMLPLVATLAALYADMDGAPRPLWLDEAFDGLDSANRAMVMDLFRSFDLDVLLAGPNRLVNVSTVPAAAIYQVVRAPAPLPGADLTLELWAGGDLTVVDTPAVLPRVGPPPTGQDEGGSQEILL